MRNVDSPVGNLVSLRSKAPPPTRDGDALFTFCMRFSDSFLGTTTLILLFYVNFNVFVLGRQREGHAVLSLLSDPLQ